MHEHVEVRRKPQVFLKDTVSFIYLFVCLHICDIYIYIIDLELANQARLSGHQGPRFNLSLP